MDLPHRSRTRAFARIPKCTWAPKNRTCSLVSGGAACAKWTSCGVQSTPVTTRPARPMLPPGTLQSDEEPACLPQAGGGARPWHLRSRDRRGWSRESAAGSDTDVRTRRRVFGLDAIARNERQKNRAPRAPRDAGQGFRRRCTQLPGTRASLPGSLVRGCPSRAKVASSSPTASRIGASCPDWCSPDTSGRIARTVKRGLSCGTALSSGSALVH